MPTSTDYIRAGRAKDKNQSCPPHAVLQSGTLDDLREMQEGAIQVTMDQQPIDQLSCEG